jgi:hypothetical protein
LPLAWLHLQCLRKDSSNKKQLLLLKSVPKASNKEVVMNATKDAKRASVIYHTLSPQTAIASSVVFLDLELVFNLATNKRLLLIKKDIFKASQTLNLPRFARAAAKNAKTKLTVLATKEPRTELSKFQDLSVSSKPWKKTTKDNLKKSLTVNQKREVFAKETTKTVVLEIPHNVLM